MTFTHFVRAHPLQVQVECQDLAINSNQVQCIHIRPQRGNASLVCVQSVLQLHCGSIYNLNETIHPTAVPTSLHVLQPRHWPAVELLMELSIALFDVNIPIEKAQRIVLSILCPQVTNPTFVLLYFFNSLYYILAINFVLHLLLHFILLMIFVFLYLILFLFLLHLRLSLLLLLQLL